jgi:NADH:ubiquinone oxidoreductase subunit 2 (subunit N)
MLSSFQHILLGFLLFVGVFSLIFGMAGAFAEKTIKRFFVYSSMGHVGFMVTAMAVSNVSSISAVFHYLFIYFISSYLMWFVLIVMGRSRTNLAHFGSLKNIDK